MWNGVLSVLMIGKVFGLVTLHSEGDLYSWMNVTTNLMNDMNDH